MANRFAKYDDYEVVVKPVKIPFKMKSGGTVYIKAVRTSLQKRKVRARAHAKHLVRPVLGRQR